MTEEDLEEKDKEFAKKLDIYMKKKYSKKPPFFTAEELYTNIIETKTLNQEQKEIALQKFSDLFFYLRSKYLDNIEMIKKLYKKK